MAPISTRQVTGTQTLVETTHPTTIIPAITLRLRAVPAETRHIHWAEDVVDNEGLGRKQSKLCCIFHKARKPGESSDEDSDSDSSSDSSSGDDGASDGRAKMTGKGKPKNRRHQHGDGEGNCGGRAGKDGGNDKDRAKMKVRNAYEKAPKNRSTREIKK